MTENKACFVIAPIGETNSDTRRRSDQILRHIISPAAKECGYEAVRADQISEPGIITSQVIQHVVTDALVIADLSERNANVYYELAIRHAIKKPLVQIINKGEPLPFDIAGTRTISVDHRDLDSVEKAKKEIISQIMALEANSSEIDTPISVALDLKILRQSENPEQRSLADILSSIAELRRTTTDLGEGMARMRHELLNILNTFSLNLMSKIEEFSDVIADRSSNEDRSAITKKDSASSKARNDREPRW
jgi:uncharacterized protein YhaN